MKGRQQHISYQQINWFLFFLTTIFHSAYKQEMTIQTYLLNLIGIHIFLIISLIITHQHLELGLQVVGSIVWIQLSISKRYTDESSPPKEKDTKKERDKKKKKKPECSTQNGVPFGRNVQVDNLSSIPAIIGSYKGTNRVRKFHVLCSAEISVNWNGKVRNRV